MSQSAADARPFNALAHLHGRADREDIPLTVVAELTHACNVDCEHCYLELVPDSKIGAMSTEEWKRAFREVRSAGTLFLTLTGGEVLVRRDFFELAAYARELGFALRIFTNGTLVDESKADRIAALKPLSVEISLLGGIPATHDAITRRRGSFDKTMAGIARLRARGVPVLLKCVFMDKNVAERDAIREIAERFGCRTHFDIELAPKDDGGRAPQELAAGHDALVEAMSEIVSDSIARFGQPKAVPYEERLASTPCGAGRRTCQIGPTGDVFPCTQWKTQRAGTVRETHFAEIWKSSTLLQSVRAMRVKDFPICNGCALLEICNPCMALSMLETGKMGPSPTKCAAAEVRAKAQGVAGRSAFFLAMEEGHASSTARDATQNGTQVASRVRLPLVG